ncbi:unnamed protein product, partial [Prorocentrum cordatum]
MAPPREEDGACAAGDETCGTPPGGAPPADLPHALPAAGAVPGVGAPVSRGELDALAFEAAEGGEDMPLPEAGMVPPDLARMVPPADEELPAVGEDGMALEQEEEVPPGLEDLLPESARAGALPPGGAEGGGEEDYEALLRPPEEPPPSEKAMLGEEEPAAQAPGAAAEEPPHEELPPPAEPGALPPRAPPQRASPLGRRPP